MLKKAALLTERHSHAMCWSSPSAAILTLR